MRRASTPYLILLKGCNISITPDPGDQSPDARCIALASTWQMSRTMTRMPAGQCIIRRSAPEPNQAARTGYDAADGAGAVAVEHPDRHDGGLLGDAHSAPDLACHD